jgi:nicotinamidase-related amidase
MSSSSKKFGLEALLTPETSVLVLIDHQPFQFANLHSHEPTMVVNNVVGLAKAAKGFQVPTILTTVTEERGGYLIKGLHDVFPDQKPINRTTLNAWEDKRVVDAVKKTGRRQLIFAALVGSSSSDSTSTSWLRRGSTTVAPSSALEATCGA